jgi:hypothetical protein
VGDTKRVEPVPIDDPVQLEFVYHFHDAPAPSDPPTTLSVLDEPAVIAVGEAVAPVGAVDVALTVTVALAVVVLLQAPSARTK